MSGILFQTTSPSTAQNLKKFYPDKIMSNGSLVLLDASRLGIENAPITGDPIQLRNVAKDTALALMPGSTEAQLSPFYDLDGYNSNAMLLERTPKKGLHVIMSKINDVANQFLVLNFPLKVREYMQTNVAHSFYVSSWKRDTRESGTPTIGHSYFLINTATYRYAMQGSANTPDSVGAPARVLGNNRNVSSSQYWQTTGLKFSSIGFKDMTGVPSSPANETDALFVAGNKGPFAGFTLHNNWSQIFYRAYVEDLTVSGRTYAEVYALDIAMFNEAFAVGGKYAGDTFTDPSILA